MKHIPLTQGKYAIVDDEDYWDLIQFKWHLHNKKYVGRNIGNRKKQCIHRRILNAPIGTEVDHINGNGLDNRKENLRIVTRRENGQNMAIHRNGKLCGVNRMNAHHPIRPYKSGIRINKKQLHLGCYKTPEEAHHVYKLACWLFE